MGEKAAFILSPGVAYQALPSLSFRVKGRRPHFRATLVHLHIRELPEPPLHKLKRNGDEHRHCQNELTWRRSITGWGRTSSSAGFGRYAQTASISGYTAEFFITELRTMGKNIG
jgi:hypothetical protein